MTTLVSDLLMVSSNFALRYFLKYIQFMSWSIMKFFLVLFQFYRLKLYEKFSTAVCNAIRNNNGNNPDGFLFDFETASINSIQKVYQRRIYLVVSFIFHRACGSIPKCWITRTLHQRPLIWFTVTYDCCFKLCSHHIG